MTVGASLELSGRAIAADMEAQISAGTGALLEQGVRPHLMIATNNYEHPPTKKYIDLKTRVAKRLGMFTSSAFEPNTACLLETIQSANEDPRIHGIIVQLPPKDPETTDEVIAAINPNKDVDGLRWDSPYLANTAAAILRLMDGHGIRYLDQRVRIKGKGRLVGGPLFRHLRENGALDVEAYDAETPPDALAAGLDDGDIIISATGRPLHSGVFRDWSRPRVLIDAGTAEQDGVVKGDVSDELRRAALTNGWRITPEHGGVGVITVRGLLLNTVQAAESQTAIRTS